MKLLRIKSLTTYDIWLLAQCAAVSTKRSEISVPPQNHSIPESFPPIRWVRPSAAMCGNSPTLVFHPPTRYSVNRKALAPPPPKITTTKHKVLNILKARICIADLRYFTRKTSQLLSRGSTQQRPNPTNFVHLRARNDSRIGV